jgi:cation diffusion facilitator CzcD-associated flavoprotein CzcO
VDSIDDGQVQSVVIIGSGFSGLGAGVKLKEAGFHDFLILERAQRVGGTWRDNSYPGCACDVPSHLYSFSFAPKPDWSRTFPPQAEILEYLEACATSFGLRPHLRFGAEVIEARYDEAAALWSLRTRDGRTLRARAVIGGMGALSNPSIPSVPGHFAGPAFHSAQWDHSVSLVGKRVAIVGSAASAVQIVPAIAPTVARLDLYQRSASWVLPKPDRPIRPWEQRLFATFPLSQKVLRLFIYLLLESRILAFTKFRGVMRLLAKQVRGVIDRAIADPQRRNLVTPTYTPGCKRLLISNDWYPALARENVNVITSPLRELRETGVVTDDGTLREVDVIVWATGFKVQDPLPRATFFGVGGVDVLDVWKQGPEAFLGITITGFPNLFLLMGPNTGLGHNSMILMIEAQIRYVVQALTTMREQRLNTIEVKAADQAAFVDEMQQSLSHTVWASGCRSWYSNEHGRITALWPGSTLAYRRRTAKFSLSNYVTRSNR